ncbi:putative thioredoxin [Lactarius quietus]|nr:putative thioredoxin [Lactarius quietus]
MVKEIKSLQEFKEIISSGKAVAVYFSANWCGPCRFISPIFEQVAATPEYSGVECYKVDIDDRLDIGRDVGIRAVPTFKLYKGGEKIDELVGADKGELQALLHKGQNLP